MKEPAPPRHSYDLILVGTGFASSFFLHKYLQRSPEDSRVLVLEGGKRISHSFLLQNQEYLGEIRKNTFVNSNPAKPWIHSPIFGGGSNCWWGCTPRFLPNDLRLKSLYGVGTDWPITYDDLEKYYCEAEEIMQVAGPEVSPQARSRAYPQVNHRLTEPDLLLQKARPSEIFALPCARARRATKHRPRCCATGVCGLCPIDAKFTVLNELGNIYEDPRVQVIYEAKVLAVDIAAHIAKGVLYSQSGRNQSVQGSLIVLGANALFNPVILQQSGITHPMIGTRLHEQLSFSVILDLAGLDNFQGGTSLTAHGYQRYDGIHRRDMAACLMESSNIPDIRLEFGKWRQRLQLKFIFEDLPEENNRVSFDKNRPGIPIVKYHGHGAYALEAKRWVINNLQQLLTPLPIERIVGIIENDTESHILGTAMMGKDESSSVVDANLRLHSVPNLLCLGGSAFPTCSPANPTLTICALSLRAADNLF